MHSLGTQQYNKCRLFGYRKKIKTANEVAKNNINNIRQLENNKSIGLSK